MFPCLTLTHRQTIYEIPPRKKQRGYRPSEDVDLFVPLMKGEEPAENVELRSKLFIRFWGIQQGKIDHVLSHINSSVIERVAKALLVGNSHVLANSSIGRNLEKLSKDPLAVLPKTYKKIKTVVINSEITSQGVLFEQLGEYLEDSDNSIKVAFLGAKQNATPKKVLKNLITQIVDSQSAESDPDLSDDEDVGPSEYNTYDFETLMSWYMEKATSTKFEKVPVVVIVLKDVDSFKTNVLEFLLRIIKSYSPRIDLKLVMGKVSSSDLFQEKLPRSLCKDFEVDSFRLDDCRKTLDDILMATLFSDEYPDDLFPLLFSQKLAHVILKRQRESSPSIEGFISLLKYAYMSHFFGQPLSVLAVSSGYKLTSRHVKCLKLFPSFQCFVEGILGDVDLQKSDKSLIISQLLDQDSITESLLNDNFVKLRKWRVFLNGCIRLSRFILDRSDNNSNITAAEMLNQLLQYPTLVKIPFYKSLCMAVSRFTPRDFVAVLKFLNENQHNQLFAKIYKKTRKIAQPLNELSSDIQEHERDTFNKISEKFISLVEDVLRRCVGPLLKKDLLFLEAVTLDVAGDFQENLVTSAFLPSVRSAIHLSLFNPATYFLQTNATEKLLDQEAVLTKLSNVCEPNLCELYRLYREANVNINIYDFYNAFTLRMSSEKMVPIVVDHLTNNHDLCDMNEKEAKDIAHALRSVKENPRMWEKITLSWFLQGIAELGHIGFLKDSRKRVEAVDKSVWKGL